MTHRAISSRVLIGTAIGVLVCSADPVAGQDSIVLKPKLELGQKYYLERLATVVQGGGRKTTFHFVQGMIEEVKGSTQEGLQLILTIDRYGFRGPKEIGSFDTDLDAQGQSEALGSILRAMVGSRLTLKLDKKFKIKSCKGTKDIVKKVEKKLEESQLWNMLFKNGVDDENYRAIWGESRFVLYPHKKVEVGDTWKNSYVEDDPQIGKIRSDYKMKLEQIETKGDSLQAIVSFSAAVSKVEGSEPADAKVRFKSGQVDGTAIFDAKKGQFVKIESKSTSILETSRMGQSLEVPVSGEGKLTLISMKRREQQREARAQEATDEGKSSGGDK